LRAMKPLSVLPRQLSVGGRSVLFTDKSLVDDRRERVSRKQTELLSEQFFKCADGDKISIYTHY
jgi:hypothetical protein